MCGSGDFTTFDWCVFYDQDRDCVFIRVNFYGLGEILKIIGIFKMSL